MVVYPAPHKRGRHEVVGQFDCGRLPGWKTAGPGRILRLMDDPAIKLYPDKNSGAWNWELLLRGKRIAYGKSSDSQEAAYAAAKQALAEERERRSNVTDRHHPKRSRDPQPVR